MKKIFIILSLFLLVGCSSKYELTIDGNEFDETITTYIYDGDREADLFDGVESGNRIDGYLYGDSYPFFANYDYVYDKEVEKIEDYERVQLKYKYTGDEYKNSNAINLCFHEFSFNDENNKYDINLGGYFYCLYNNESLDIIIETKNEVFKNNADEVVKNKYIWHINQDNYKNVSIQINLAKEKSNKTIYIFTFVLSSIIILIAIILISYILKRRKEMNKF